MQRALAVVLLGFCLSMTLADVALARIKLNYPPRAGTGRNSVGQSNATLVEEERIVRW